MRDTIFISHSTPGDNDFTRWLASRLQLLGYKVWCDLEGLVGGEIFWDDIDNQIRNHCIKFLFVVSENIFSEPGKLKQGVRKEFDLAESLAKSVGGDFVIPLKVDAAAYNSYIGLNVYNAVKFHENWASGFSQLVKKLEKDDVPKASVANSGSQADWHKNVFTSQHAILEKEELYFSNWLEIKELPKYLYIFQYENETQAKLVRAENELYPAIRHGNSVASFEETPVEPKYTSDLEDYAITPIEKYEISTDSILNNTYESDTFPSLLDCKNILKWLLNEAFENMMKEKRLWSYSLANRKKCYYFPRSLKKKVSFAYRGKQKTKNLNGTYYSTKYWHVAISARAQTEPILAYSLKVHLLFSDDGVHIWQSPSKLHAARRSKGKRWFNEEWRDILLAFINALKDEDGKIDTNLSRLFGLSLPDTTFSLASDVGYNEPGSERLDILSEGESDDSRESVEANE